MRYLTSTERENIAARTARNRPELIGYRDRVRVVTFPAPQPKPLTKVEFDEWQREAVGEIAGQGMPPGPPLNLARRSQRRQVYGELVAFTVIGAGALIGLGILAWAVFSIVRQALG